MSLDYCDTCQTTTVHDKTRPEPRQCLRCYPSRPTPYGEPNPYKVG